MKYTKYSCRQAAYGGHRPKPAKPAHGEKSASSDDKIPRQSAFLRILNRLLDAKGFYKAAWANANRIVPKTAALLRAGEPFPTWEDWLKL